MKNNNNQLWPMVFTAFFVVQALSIFVVYRMGISGVILNTILFGAQLVTFYLKKETFEEATCSVCFKMIKASFVFYILAFVNMPLRFIVNLGREIPFVLIIMLNLIGLILGAGALMTDSAKKIWDSIYEATGFSTTKAQDEQTGDVRICYNKETKEPVVIPLKDRFLHMLILGATGTGKTSQVLLPMINQDLKNKEAGITVLEPKSDLAEQVYAMATLYDRPAIYFNPISENCPCFNPLYGPEDEVIENMVVTFKMLNPDSQTYFQDMNEQLLRNALKVLKRLYKNEATLIDLSRLLQNSGGVGKEIVVKFSRIPAKTESIAKENNDIAKWFMNDYFMEKSKTYENTSGIRSQVSKLTANTYLRRVLNPENGKNEIDFAKHLEEGTVMAITTCQGILRDLGKFLGYFIILQFQSAVFRRPGREQTRRPHFLYIDEFQVYSNPGFSDMLTQGRSYRVASHLATQNRDLISMGAGRDGKNFLNLVSTNARNLILFPDCNITDAEYYAKQFGEIEKMQVDKGYSKTKFNLAYGIQKMRYPTETVRETMKKEARFSATDLIYGAGFGEITYSIVKNNSRQLPDRGKIEFLPSNIIEATNRILEEYNKNNLLTRIEDEEDSLESYDMGDFIIVDDVDEEVIKADSKKENAAITKTETPGIAENIEDGSDSEEELAKFIAKEDNEEEELESCLTEPDEEEIRYEAINVFDDEDDLL